MSSSVSQLSAAFTRLSSLERRFIILVIVILFIVINLIFVLPHFGDLGKIANRFGETNTKLAKYQKEIAQVSVYEKNVKELEGEGAAVPPEDQSVNFQMAILNQTAQSGVSVIAQNRQPERTNQFFVERAQALTVQSSEAQLVDFLYNLGAGSSLIRARALSIQPDPPHTGLSATMTLVASYQKKPTARTAPVSAKPPASAPSPTPASKPAPSAGLPMVKTNKSPAVTPPNKSLTPTPK